MSRFVSYQNGNYTVHIDTTDGTKIRENNLDFFRADFPESIDIKITNKCDRNCAYCHENSRSYGIHGDILSESFIDKLHPYTELAIGGGNPLEHPDLIPFLQKCKDLKLIPSMTVHQYHFEEHFAMLKWLVDNGFIYGLGVSFVGIHNDFDFIEMVKQIPNAVIHVINGISSTMDGLERLAHNNLKLLILGYKEFRRGESHYEEHSATIDLHKEKLYNMLPRIIKEEWFDVVSFDNLAVTQLNVKRLMSDSEWNEFYLGDDGSHTMYVDMVNRKFAKSSTSTDRYDLMDNIVDMFNKIRTS